LRVASLHIHPVKGGRAARCARAQVKARGFEHDRRWLVTDMEDQFLTQRSCPALARLVAAPIASGVHLAMEGAGEIDVVRPLDGVRRMVVIWKDNVAALDAGKSAGDWLSTALGRPVRLYYMDGDAAREYSGGWGSPAPVSFADGFPYLITTTASLAALNEEIARAGAAPAGMERFRPNIVIDGANAWAEDFWRTIRIGDVVFDLLKPCARCVVTTTDQQTGERLGKEPLRSLAKIRRSADPRVRGVLFGWNAVAHSEGEIAAGDDVTIVEARAERWPFAAPEGGGRP